MGGGCDLPLGAHCLSTGHGWSLHAQILQPDGEQSIQLTVDSILNESAPELGQRAAEQMIRLGALDLLTTGLVDRLMSPLAQEIEETYKREMCKRFPNADCQTLVWFAGGDIAEIVTELDLYFSALAGYACSATTLHMRSPKQLLAAKCFLIEDLFEYVPAFARYRHLIEVCDVPELREKNKSIRICSYQTS